MVAILSNTRKSTPRDALEIMYGVPPVDLEIKREALLALQEIEQLSNLNFEGVQNAKPLL